MLPPVAALAVPWRNQGAGFARDDGAPALVDLSTGVARHFSYREVQAGCDAAARGLLVRGLDAGSRVAVVAANSAEVLFGLYGAMRAGLVAVPVNWKLPAATVGAILEDCGAALVLHDGARRGLCPAGAVLVDVASDWMRPGAHEVAVPGAHDPALFLYTSGSTGRPKGVVLSHHSHLWVMDVRVRATAAPARALVAAPLYHMNALAMVQSVWATGGVVILLPGFDSHGYIAAAAAHGATALTAVPTMIAMMLREHAALAAADLSAVAAVRVGSAPITEALVAEVRRVFPGAVLSNGYGTTEAGPVVFEPDAGAPPTSVGRAHKEASLRLVRDGRVVEGVGEGVLEMRCPALMLGYHNLAEATAKAMTADGFYRTGDVFERDGDGYFTFVGRADDMFNSGGENIYPGEVEAVMARHPEVQQVAVVPVPDAMKGHKPVAFVVARPGTCPTEEGLKRFVLEHAPPYHHPRRVWFVDALPLAGTNKIDRRALMVRAAAEGEGLP